MRFLDHLRLHRHLGAVGLDHHQTRILQQLLRIDARLLDARLFGVPLLRTGRLDGRRRRRLVTRLLLLGLFMPRLFRARLELVDAALLFGERSRGRRVLVARRTISAIAVAVAAAAVAPSAPMLFAFALGPWTLALGRELMELRRFA